MRLLFNATNVRSQGGVILLGNLLKAFLAVRPDLELVLYANPELQSRLPGLPDRVETVFFRPRGYLGRFRWEQHTLPGILRQRGVDILFSFGNTGPRYPGCRQILYVQQAIPYTDYTPSSHRIRWRFFQALYGWLIGLAQLGSDKIVVPTSWLVAPMRASTGWKKPESDYRVSLPGLPKLADDGTLSVRETGLLAQVREWKDQGEAILLYPCYLAPYKNIPGLLEAVSRLIKSSKRPFKLLLTLNRSSPEYFPCRAEVFSTLDRLGLEGQPVILTGELSRAALARLYPLADALVFPSLVETLGLPLLEAMAFGVPVVAAFKEPPARMAAFAREICGEAALYADPDFPADLADTLARLLEDEDERKRLGEAARKRAATFSWHRHAAEILE